MRIWTIGHSTRTIEEFVSVLEENEINLLADVRVAGLETLSAVQQGSAGGIAKCACNSLRTFPRAWRQAKIDAGFAQHGLAQRLVPGLCRLHGDKAISE